LRKQCRVEEHQVCSRLGRMPLQKLFRLTTDLAGLLKAKSLAYDVP
jgi:hypothetical protein